LVFAPSAPHEPWRPAPQDAGSFDGVAVAAPSSRVVNDVRGKPEWVRAVPAIARAAEDALVEQRRDMLETLGAVDRALRSLVADVRTRAELERTIVVFLSDNGYSFGEHRWVGKRCPYDACVHTPLVVRSPWTGGHVVTAPVSNVDLAPTILDLVGLDVPGIGTDGTSLRPVLDDRIDGSLPRDAVLIEWAGDGDVPAWRGLRTDAFSYLEHADGTVELYDLLGRFGPADPSELRNRADAPAYVSVRRELAVSLAELAGDGPLPALP
ncbi:MAG: sulfatase/phosphatase domain-containing protein, partial [Actinomycetota bacterium]